MADTDIDFDLLVKAGGPVRQKPGKPAIAASVATIAIDGIFILLLPCYGRR